MFDDLIDTNVEKLRPHFQAAAGRVEGFSWMLLAKLDQIAENTKQEAPFTLRRERVQMVLEVGTRVELDAVPMGQEWELEAVSIGAAATLTIDNGVGFVWAQIRGAATVNPYPGQGIIFEAGTPIGLTASGAGTPVPIYVQFACKTPRLGRRAVAGFETPDTQAVGPYAPVERHVSPNTGHRPIVPSGDAPMGAS